MNLLTALQTAFADFLQTHYPDFKGSNVNEPLELNTDPDRIAFGDLSSPIALGLAKHLGRAPRSIAQEISQKFSHDTVERIEIAGPGFLNFFLSHDAFIEIARDIFVRKDTFFADNSHQSIQNMIVEYVSANPTGPLHVGHGRGAIIGDVVTRIKIFLKHPTFREFYINDAGSQITKLGFSVQIRAAQAAGEQVQLPEEAYHGEYVTAVAHHLEKQYGAEFFKKSAEEIGVKAADYLLKKIKETLHEYRVSFDMFFSEKQLHTSGAIAQTIEFITQRGHTYVQDGAVWFKSTAFGDDKDRVLQKADGSFTYAAADLAYLKNKKERGFEHYVVVLGQDHHSYLQRLKGMAIALGYGPDYVDVILYQLVTLKNDGELMRMSKRAGTMVTLEDIIRSVGSDVARFFYLHRKADAHLDFDIDLALKKTDENPAYYLQYAYVRCVSIMAKARLIEAYEGITEADLTLLNDEEKLVIRKICSLKTLLPAIAQTYQTHLLSYYTLELAQLLHRYYAHCTVLDERSIPLSRGRLVLIETVRQTLQLCLQLMGISTPEIM